MKKRHLEMALSKMKDMEGPDPRWEQYRTPPRIVSDILWMALENGDVEDKSVVELGCGGAPFALGALMLGAKEITGVDIDPRSIELAEENLREIIDQGILTGNEDFIFLQGDVAGIEEDLGPFDTVFMNPPFGSQKKHADRPFIEKACMIGRTVYSIHNGVTEEFVKKEFLKNGFLLDETVRTTLEIPHRFRFHNRAKADIDIVIVTGRKS